MFNEGNVYPTIQDSFVAAMFVASGSWIQKDIIFHAGKNILRGVVVFVYVTGNSFMDTGSFPIYNDSIPDVGYLKQYDYEPQRNSFDEGLLSDDSSTSIDWKILRIGNTDWCLR